MRLDEIAELLRKQSETLVRNTVTLEEHMRRTDANERRIELMEERFLKAMNWVAGGAVSVALSLVALLLRSK